MFVLLWTQRVALAALMRTHGLKQGIGYIVSQVCVKNVGSFMPSRLLRKKTNGQYAVVIDYIRDTAGCEFISKWLVIPHCLKIQQLMEAAKCDVDYMLGVVSGTVEFPDVWRPGLRPCA